MNEAQILPYTKPMKNEAFFYFIMIFDIITQGFFGFFFGIIGIIINATSKNFNSEFFKIYSIIRIFYNIILLFILILLLIGYIFGDFKNFYPKDKKILENKILIITIWCFLFIFFLWNTYLSYIFLNQIVLYQDSENEKENLIDNKTMNESFNKKNNEIKIETN